MKQSLKAIITLGFFLAVSASTLFAQGPDIYSIDEYGNGYSPLIYSHYLTYALSSEVAPDPTGGITNSPVLIYYLMDPVVPGDVALIGTNQSVAKLLRFFMDTEGNSDVIFYSQADGTPAGTGIPLSLSTNLVQIVETNPITTWAVPILTPPSNLPGSYSAYGVPELLTGIEYYIHNSCPAQPPCLSGTNMIWNYTVGVPNASVVVMASTNLSLSITKWDCISSNQFDFSGSCLLTLPVDPAKPCLFYRIGWTAYIIPPD